jgi:hypothetical protein
MIEIRPPEDLTSDNYGATTTHVVERGRARPDLQNVQRVDGDIITLNISDRFALWTGVDDSSGGILSQQQKKHRRTE